MSDKCPFCTTAKEEGRMLKDGRYAYVIFSNPRLMPGHLLVVTKRHVQRLAELHEEERKELLDLVIEFEERVLAKLASGCDIRQHYHPFLENDGIAVNHFHFHIQPREPKDRLWEKSQQFERPLFEKLSEEEQERLFQLLSN